MINLEEIKRRMDGIGMNPQPTDLHLDYYHDVNSLIVEIERVQQIIREGVVVYGTLMEHKQRGAIFIQCHGPDATHKALLLNIEKLEPDGVIETNEDYTNKFIKRSMQERENDNND